MRLAAVFVLLSTLVACSGGGKESQTSAVNLEREDLTKLVYWPVRDWQALSTNPQPSAHQLEVIDALSEAGDRYLPYLLDLVFLPTPYRDEARAILYRQLGTTDGDAERVGLRGFLDWVEQRGFREAGDDSQEYLEFKEKLFRTIQGEIADFLDPWSARSISAQEVFWGGVGVDEIPPLEEPAFVTPAAAATWIKDHDQVIGVEVNGDARAYPRRIIDWHEMVNDTVGGVPVSLAYCTLCGSAILYEGRVGDTVYRFGTSGLLYRSNKLMYDRTTRTLWEQYTGEPVWGELAGSGVRLSVLPVVHTTWAEWYADHPDTQVLDIDTGHYRDYGSGVAYADYWLTPELWFPAPNRDGPLEAKDVVYAVRINGELTAYPISLLAQEGLIHDEFADESVVLISTADGSGGRAYRAGELTFEIVKLDDGLLRSTDGRSWTVTEAALVADDGSTLDRLPGHNSFWFAVINQHPESRLFDG
jgi:Protein of unknown function (DUF3179)